MSINLNIVLSAFAKTMRFKSESGQIDITAQTEINELGLDSMDIAEVLVLIEQDIGYELDYFSFTPLQRIIDFTQLEKV